MLVLKLANPTPLCVMIPVASVFELYNTFSMLRLRVFPHMRLYEAKRRMLVAITMRSFPSWRNNSKKVRVVFPHIWQILFSGSNLILNVLNTLIEGNACNC
jgi:hypothetical protein